MRTAVFTDVKVFDGTRFLAQRQDVTIEDAGIVSVEPHGRAEHAPGARIVDGSGSTLTPGFIDCHVHVMTGTGTSLAAFATPFSMPFYQSTAFLRETLHAGVTTVRDAGGADLGARRALDEGIIEGPRLRISISVMSQTGGHADGWLPSGVDHPFMAEHPGRPSGIADGVDGVRACARRILRAGADQIKICTTGGVLSPADDPRHSQFTAAEIRAVVEEASEQERHVMAHAQGAAGIAKAVTAGVRSIEHGIYLDDATIDLMLEHGTYLVPTLQAPRQVVRNADAGVPLLPATVEKARSVIDRHAASIARAHEAGVPIAMGTDAGVGPHGQNLEELELMCEVGLSTEDALRSATSTAAELMGMEGIGRIAPGALADLVLVDGDLSQSGVAGVGDRVQQVWQAGRKIR